MLVLHRSGVEMKTTVNLKHAKQRNINISFRRRQSAEHALSVILKAPSRTLNSIRALSAEDFHRAARRYKCDSARASNCIVLYLVTTHRGLCTNSSVLRDGGRVHSFSAIQVETRPRQTFRRMRTPIDVLVWHRGCRNEFLLPCPAHRARRVGRCSRC